jgi:acetyl esterase/lipase
MTMLMRAILLVLPALAGCAPARLLNATIRTSDLEITRDVPYAPGPRGGLDVYRPRGGTDRLPLIVFLYGGSWRMGNKAMYRFVAAGLARRGAVVMVPDYRLYPEVQFPAFLQDNARAVAWAIVHAAEYGADPDAVFVMGHSAGAYNAAMLALDPRWLAAEGADRGRLAGVVGLAGPYDFLPITDPEIIPVFAAAGDGAATQPVTYADGQNPPLLLLAGDADTTVRPRNTAALAARVEAAGGPVQQKIYSGLGHLGIVMAFAPLFRGRAPVLEDVSAFVAAHRPRHAGRRTVPALATAP